MTNIAQAIQTLSGASGGRLWAADARVVSVSQSDRTCVVELQDGQSSNTLTARLMASVDDGCLMLPSVDSTVVLHGGDRVKPYVAMMSEVDEIVWLGGEYDGVPIVKHPSNTNKGLLKKINNLENLINDLITNYNTHTHVLTLTMGTGTADPTTTQQTTNIAPLTAQADIEHPKITH